MNHSFKAVVFFLFLLGSFLCSMPAFAEETDANATPVYRSTRSVKTAAAKQPSAAESTSDEARVDRKLKEILANQEKILANQDTILQKFDAIMEELRIIKVRATIRSGS